MLRKFASLAACVLTLVVTTDWLRAQAPTPGVRQRTLVYAAVPDTDLDQGGAGILVFDRDANWKFMKRIPIWDYRALDGPGNIRGISAHVATARLYVTAHRGVAAWDLNTDKMLWHTDTLSHVWDKDDCCDNGLVTADGKHVIVGSRRIEDRWWALDANTGKIVKEIPSPESIGPHNLLMSPDGTKAYLAPTASNYFTVIDQMTFEKVGLVGPTTFPPRTPTINGAGTLIYTSTMRLLGFEILDTRTGKLVERVEVPGFRWEGRAFGHNTPSHGVALTPDEKEVWVDNGVEGYMHVFDNTVTPKRLKANIKTRGETEAVWIIMSIDGKYAYNATGEIFDTATKKKVGELKDEYGRFVQTEKLLEVGFANGKVVKAGERGGIGQVRPVGTNNNNQN